MACGVACDAALPWIVLVATDFSRYDMIGLGWTLDGVNLLGGMLG